MQRQVGLVRKCVLNALLGSVAWAIPGMQALAADQLPVKAPAAVEAIPYWWWHGEVDVGGRFFLNNPQRDGLNYLRQDSLAKFYEYRDLRPGVFGNIWLSTGSRDGLYQVDIGGKNIGYSDQNYNASTGGQHYFNDQSYYLEASKAGQHYFNFIWDQTPHVYSTSALTPYNGAGGNLTLPAGLSAALWNAANTGHFNDGTAGSVQSLINANLHQTDIGFRRDTASVEYRWTPTDAWDFKTYYSHLDRSGTQAMGVIFNNSSSGIIAQAPAPVNDTTQNFGLNGEYAGTSPWGKKFNIKLAYNGSVYQGDSSFDIDSPFFDPAHPSRGNPGLNPVTPFNACNTTDCNPAFGRMSLYPDNNANAVSGTMGADLPWQSRYMGTVSYNMMRQNDAYLPFTSNVLLNPPGRILINGQPATSLAALPFTSLDGRINTLLSNNVVTTQITPELKSKFAYRYYNYDNDSPTQLFNQWVGTDEHIYPLNNTPKRSIPNSYTKQNGLAELIWTPWRGLTLGAQYGYERYNWSWNDADHTSQNLGKLYGVYKLNSWLTARGSWEFSERRYGTYTNSLQSSLNGNWNPHYRSPELANLDQNKGKFQVDVVVIPEVYVSPFAGFRFRDYKTDAYGPALELGILQDDSWNAGVELTWSPTRGAAFNFSYTYEDAKDNIVGGGGTTGLATGTWNSHLNDKSNTFTAAYKQTLIEDKLDLKLSYVYSLANGTWITNPFFYNGYVPAANPLNSPNPNYPDTRTTFQRFDALATYKVDPSLVRQMGWTGEALIKLRYAFERNSVNDWQINDMQPYMYLQPCHTGPGSIGVCGNNMMLWLAGDNPNYNVHLLAVALALKW